MDELYDDSEPDGQRPGRSRGEALGEWLTSRRWLLVGGSIGLVAAIIVAALVFGGGTEGGDTLRSSPAPHDSSTSTAAVEPSADTKETTPPSSETSSSATASTGTPATSGGSTFGSSLGAATTTTGASGQGPTTTRAGTTTTTSGGSVGPGTTGTTTSTIARPRPPQQLLWPAAAPWTFGQTLGVSVLASSGLPVSIDAASGSCAIENSILMTVKATGVGDCTLDASQAGSADWEPVSGRFVYSVGKARATLTSFSGTFTFSYAGGHSCRLIGVGCPENRLTATADVPVTFRLADSADERCRLDGSLFWLSNHTSLPVSCSVVVVGQETATHLGFEEVREATMNPFPVELTVNAPAGAAAGSADISLTTNFSTMVYGCGVSGQYEAGTYTLPVPPVAEACSVTVLAGGGDGSMDTQCRAVRIYPATDNLAPTVAECN